MGLGSIRAGRGSGMLLAVGVLLARLYAASAPCAILQSDDRSVRPPTFLRRRRHRRPDIAPPQSAAPARRRRRAGRRCNRCRRRQIPAPHRSGERLRASALALDARYGANMQQITGGLHWRIYPVKPDQGGAFRPLKEDRGAAPVFSLPPGNYVVHVGFGLASAVRAVQLRPDGLRETFEIPAGGLRIEGRVGDVRIPPGQISFDLFRGSQFEPGDRRADRAIGRGRRRDPGAGRHLSRRFALRGRQLGGALRHPRADRQADRRHCHPSRGDDHAQAREPVRRRGPRQHPVVGAHARRRRGQGIDRRVPARHPGRGRIPGRCAQRRPRTYERTFRVVTGVDSEVEVLAR